MTSQAFKFQNTYDFRLFEIDVDWTATKIVAQPSQCSIKRKVEKTKT